MKTAIPKLVLWTLLSTTWLACAGGLDGDSSSPDAGTGGSDGGVLDCTLSLQLAGEPRVGATMTASVSVLNPPVGVRSFDWQVRGDDQNTVAFDAGPNNESISFSLSTPGVYTVSVAGTAGGRTCFPASAETTAIALGAVSKRYHLHIAPPRNSSLASLDTSVSVFGGGNASVGDQFLGSAETFSGSILQHEGLPINAYLRATPVAGPHLRVREGFSDARGHFELNLPKLIYRLEVHPGPGLAPLIVPRWDPSSSPTLQLEADQLITGTVVDDGGLPIVGATIAVGSDGRPTSIGRTDESGAFFLRGQFGEALSVTIRPADSNLASLHTSLPPGDRAQAPWQIVLGPKPARAISPILVDSEDRALVSQQVELRAKEIPNIGTLSAGGIQTALRGTHVIHTITGETGRLGTTVYPAPYDVIVHGAPPRRLTLSDAGAPETLRALTPATLRLRVINEEQKPVALAQVSISAREGSLPGLWAPMAQKTAGDGTTAFPVLPNIEFEVTVANGSSWAEQRMLLGPFDSASESEEISISLPHEQLIRGRVTQMGGIVAGAHVSLYCDQCSLEQDNAISLSVTDSSGHFVLAVPDPGTVE